MAVGLPRNDRSLNPRQKLLRFGQGQSQVRNIAKTFRLADLYQIGAQATGVIPRRNQPQHIASPFPRSAIDPTDRTSRVVIPPFSYVDGPKFGNVFVRWQHIPVLVPLQFSHKRAPMRETLIGVDEGSGQLRPYVRPVVRRSPRPSWVCAGVSGTDLDSVLKAQENGRYCPSCS